MCANRKQPKRRNLNSVSVSHSGTPRMENMRYSNAYAGVYAAKAQKKRHKRHIVIAIVAAIAVVFAGAGTAAALYIQSIDRNLSGIDSRSEEELMNIQEQLVQTTTFDEPFYMMLIGSDRREDDASMGARSDTAILVRVDAPNNTVTMLSIPRDTRVNVDGHGMQKFNAAYSFDGAAGTIREVSQLCGVEISHYVEVNFEELVALVDTIGGVEVDVPYLVDDWMAGDEVIQPGLQTLNGAQALTFARTRQFADGDYTRTSNQRMLVEAIVKKVFELPITELPGLIQSVSQCVVTDMSVFDIFSLVTQFRDAGNLTMYSAMTPSTAEYIDDISYVICNETALKEMMDIIERGEDPNTLETYASIGSSINENHTLELGSSEGEGSADGANASGS